ncbi:hypothetical protein COCON_G00163730 [Conger conger]|uniref:Uncharacterized protein n=1 Tax=Conger conger TaxID=82655 RepID=A0A9Q1D6M0_CONCO|nr:hypothetical protein COCON_G00163730 [Conger conger]
MEEVLLPNPKRHEQSAGAVRPRRTHARIPACTSAPVSPSLSLPSQRREVCREEDLPKDIWTEPADGAKLRTRFWFRLEKNLCSSPKDRNVL